MQHKEAFTLIVKSQGSGSRSRPAIEAFLETIMHGFWDSKTEADILADMKNDSRFRLIASPQPIRGGSRRGGGFSASVKTAAFVAELATSGVKCGICGTLVHRNSMHSDHVLERADGGGAHSGNAQITHPDCNSGYKTRLKHRALELSSVPG